MIVANTEKIYNAMAKTNAQCAVYGLKFRTYDKDMSADKDVIYFKSYAELVSWFDSFSVIYDYPDRPIGAYILHII